MEIDMKRGNNVISSLPESLMGDRPLSPPCRPTSPTTSESEFSLPKFDQSETEVDVKPVKVEVLVKKLHDARTREDALTKLARMKDHHEVLALLLWHTSGLMFILIKEIIGAYPLISTPKMTQEVSNRICNTITLFQCIATHLDTRKPFLRAHLPLYLYPFIANENKDKAHEYLRLSSLGAVGALVKGHLPNRDEIDPEIMHFLLQSQVLSLCIRCMDVGTVLSRTVATFIVERILSTDQGLNCCCKFGDRFDVMTSVLRKMADKLVEEPCKRLLKLIIRCFIELSKGPSLCKDNQDLRCCIPRSLTYPENFKLITGDGDAIRGLQLLLNNVESSLSPNGDLVMGRIKKAELKQLAVQPYHEYR